MVIFRALFFFFLSFPTSSSHDVIIFGYTIVFVSHYITLFCVSLPISDCEQAITLSLIFLCQLLLTLWISLLLRHRALSFLIYQCNLYFFSYQCIIFHWICLRNSLFLLLTLVQFSCFYIVLEVPYCIRYSNMQQTFCTTNVCRLRLKCYIRVVRLNCRLLRHFLRLMPV